MNRLSSSLVVRTVVVALVVSGSASAQTIFVEGSAFASLERRATQSVDRTSTATLEAEPTGPELDPNGTVAGGTFTIGTWLASRVTLRLETAWPDTVEDRVTFTTTVPRPPIPITGPFPPLTATYEQQSWERARTFTTLVGYHTARRRGVQIGYLGGAAFVWRTLRQRAVSSEPSISGGSVIVGPGGQVVPMPTTVTRIDRTFDGTATGYEVGAAVGMDADIAIGSHLSAVPQIRVVGIPNGGLSIRPGVGVRATW